MTSNGHDYDGGGHHHGYEMLHQYTQPMQIPGMENDENDDDNDNHNYTGHYFNHDGSNNHRGVAVRRNNFIQTTSASYSPRWFGGHNQQQHNQSQWTTDGLLSCSPMVSAPRTNIHLPNLYLREAMQAEWADYRAAEAVASTGEGEEPLGLKRVRSRSMGDIIDNGDDISRSSSSMSLLGKHLASCKTAPTPPGDETMNVSRIIVSEDHKSDNLEFKDNGYGSTISNDAMMKNANALDKNDDILGDERNNPISSSPRITESAMKRSDSDNVLKELKEEFNSQSNPILLSILYGIVNSSIILPVIMSFGSIIYHDDFFRPYLSVLMKLTVISGAVHQITFSTVSSLPFAVGQVQDAGLIFLSAMASDMVSRCRSAGFGDDEYILATVTIGLSLYTAILGACLILVGKFKLASYCQLLPSSVVGGYLAYIGFFCGQAGLALMASVNVTGLSEWNKFFDRDALILLTPGVLGGCGIYFAIGKFRHMAVLPTCISLLLIIFYAILWSTGTSVKEAMDNGWINEAVESPVWYRTWDFLRIEKVVWRVLPSQTLTLIAMISVVGLSSSLDIAAIEIELKRPLNYNFELKTVGISNIISGMFGGYTGSYIFSQTIFSLRSGIRSRLMGYVIAFLSLLTVVVPFNIISYIPNFFFGSLLIMICLDLMFEWLIDVREKVTTAEYVVLLATFSLLQILGVEFGILGGVALHICIRKMGYDVGSDDETQEENIVVVNFGSSRNDKC